MSRTMIYTVELPDGQVADIEGPVDATPEQLQAFVAQQAVAGAATEANPDIIEAEAVGDPEAIAPSRTMSAEDETAYGQVIRTGSVQDVLKFVESRGFSMNPAALAEFIAKRDEAAKSGGKVAFDPVYAPVKPVETDAAGAAARGVMDTVTLGTLPKVGALIAGFEATLAGGDFDQAYASMLDQNNAAIGADEQDHGTARLIGQLVGGLAIPAGLEGVGVRAGAQALRGGATMAEARAVAARAVGQRMIAVSGAYGAGHGAGSADTLPDAATGAVTEGALGLAGGAVAGAVGRVVAPRLAARAAAARAAPMTDGERVMGAATRQGVDVLPADVSGPSIRRGTSAVVQTIPGAQPIIAAARRSGEQAQGVRDRLADNLGIALRPEAAGNRVTEGARQFIARTGGQANRLYTAAENAAAGARVTPMRALAILNRNITELEQTPGGSAGLNRLTTLRDALQQGDVTVTGMRNMRTALRDDFTESGLRGSDIERRVNQVVDAANEDVIAGLTAQGRRGAANAYRLADRYWRNRIRTIDDVLEPIIGKRDAPRSGEQVVKTLMADMQGNNARAVRALRALPADAQGDVRASIISYLGRSTKGNQNADGDAFSLATFLTNWNEIGDTAKAAYFGPEARAGLNDLALVAQGTKEAQRYANHSNTGGVAGNIATAATGFAGLATLGKVVAAQYLTGRLLASPRFARWLARAPRASNQEAYVSRLSRIARAEPAIANEVLQLQQRLNEAFVSAPARLAADESDGHLNGVDGNEVVDQ